MKLSELNEKKNKTKGEYDNVPRKTQWSTLTVFLSNVLSKEYIDNDLTNKAMFRFAALSSSAKKTCKQT